MTDQPMRPRDARFQTPPDEVGEDLRAGLSPAPEASPDFPDAEDAVPEEERLRAIPLVAMDRTPHAHFGIRLGAALVDLLILGAIATVLVVVFWFLGNGVVPLSAASRAQAPGLFAMYWTLVALTALGYNWLAVAAGGRTPGKQVFGLVIVKEDGTVLSGRDSAVRLGGIVLSTVCLGLGFLAILWDKNSQAWHDKIAGTDVVFLDEG